MLEVRDEHMIAAILAVMDEDLELDEEYALNQPMSINPKMVKEARAVEVERLTKHQVVTEFNESDYNPKLDGEIIDGRWVDEDRGDVGRSRVVARQFRKKDDEVKLNYAGTPDAHGIRCLLSILRMQISFRIPPPLVELNRFPLSRPGKTLARHRRPRLPHTHRRWLYRVDTPLGTMNRTTINILFKQRNRQA